MSVLEQTQQSHQGAVAIAQAKADGGIILTFYEWIRLLQIRAVEISSGTVPASIKGEKEPSPVDCAKHDLDNADVQYIVHRDFEQSERNISAPASASLTLTAASKWTVEHPEERPTAPSMDSVQGIIEAYKDKMMHESNVRV
jgi:hypothetical protein